MLDTLLMVGVFAAIVGVGCPCNVPEIFAESDLQEREWEFECPRKENGNDMTCTECWNREYKGE